MTDTYGERKVHSKKGLGLVNEVFDEESLQKLKGNLGVGHVRYSTAVVPEQKMRCHWLLIM